MTSKQARAEARRRLGQRAEALVADRYAAEGFTIEARNWSCRVGELDVVAARGGLLVFVEVRAHSTDFLASPTMTVSRAKQARVARAADRYLAARPQSPVDIRFDVVGVRFGRRQPTLDVVENAFIPAWGF